MGHMFAPGRAVFLGVGLLGLGACGDQPFDLDFRDLGNGFDTSEAVLNLPDRPRPDDRGIISYPNYQVVVAQRDDTIGSIAGRLGLDATTLGRYNGIGVDVPLRRDELIALPTRVAEPSPATGAAATGPIQPLDVTAVATTALDRVDAQPAPSNTPDAPSGVEPIRHQVQTGETVYSIARRYGVPVANIAQWNGLGSELTVREGQFLLIPPGGQPGSVPTSAVEGPGTGSTLPAPPSAAQPLPTDDTAGTTATSAPAAETPPAPDIGTPAPAPSTASARLVYPVQGSIIRAYAAGRNEGIDIGVPAGTAVKAADAGTVAAITQDTNGIDILVIRHADNLLTVYTNVDDLSVAKNDTVSRGQTIANVRAGDPSFLHFEVRRGLQSVDPADFLP